MNEGGEGIPIKPPAIVDNPQPEIKPAENPEIITGETVDANEPLNDNPQIPTSDQLATDAIREAIQSGQLTPEALQALQQARAQSQSQENQPTKKEKRMGLMKKLGLGFLIVFFMSIWNGIKKMFGQDQQQGYH